MPWQQSCTKEWEEGGKKRGDGGIRGMGGEEENRIEAMQKKEREERTTAKRKSGFGTANALPVNAMIMLKQNFMNGVDLVISSEDKAPLQRMRAAIVLLLIGPVGANVFSDGFVNMVRGVWQVPLRDHADVRSITVHRPDLGRDRISLRFQSIDRTTTVPACSDRYMPARGWQGECSPSSLSCRYVYLIESLLVFGLVRTRYDEEKDNCCNH
eukprot:763395-Hanusia_phi.AAC.8